MPSALAAAVRYVRVGQLRSAQQAGTALQHAARTMSTASTSTAVELDGEPASRLCIEDAGRMMYVRYPQECAGGEFARDYASACEDLAAATQEYGLVHDLRLSDLRTIRVQQVLADAGAIAGLGKVSRVAIVLDCNSVVKATISLGLRLCPVQPARIFADVSEAREWAYVPPRAEARFPSDAAATRMTVGVPFGAAAAC